MGRVCLRPRPDEARLHSTDEEVGQCGVEKVFRSLDRFVGKTQESSIPISKLNCTGQFCTAVHTALHIVEYAAYIAICSELQ